MVAAATAPVKKNITVFKGESYNLNVGVVDATGAARDLTGYAVRMQIRTDVDSGTAVNTYTGGSGIILGTPSTGTFQIAIPDTDTAAWTASTYVYDVLIDNGTTSGVEVLLQGSITARKKVTT